MVKSTALLTLLCVALLSTPALANELREQANAAFFAEDHNSAYKILISLVNKNEANAQDFLFKGLIERKDGDLTKAQHSFRNGLRHEPNSVPLLMELAITSAWDGHHQVAVKLYDQVLSVQPNDLPAALGKARVLGWMGHNTHAITLYTTLLKKNPSNVEALTGLATIRRNLMEDERATSLYTRALDLNPAQSEALEGLALIDARTRYQWSSTMTSVYVDEQTKLQGQADLAWQWTPSWTLHTGYAVESAESPWLVSTESRQIGTLGATLRTSDALTTSASYSAVFAEEGLGHRLSLAGNLKLSDSTALMAGFRPELDADSRLGGLARGGLSVQLTSWWSTWTQLFASQGPTGEKSLVWVGSTRFDIYNTTSLGFTAGAGKDDAHTILTAGAEIGFPLTDRLGTTIGYEHLRRDLASHTARLTLKGQF